MTTSSEEAGQTPLEMIHRKVAEAPTVNPVTAEEAEEGVETEAEPETTVQVPRPTPAELAEREVEERLQRF